MDKLSKQIGSIKEKIVLGGIILFIVYIIIGIIFCLSGSNSSSSYSETYSVFSKFISTAAMAGLCLFCLYDNLNKLSGDNKVARILALISVIAVPVYLVFYFLSGWQVIELTECTKETAFYGYSYCSQNSLNIFGKLLVILGSAISLGTIGSMTLSIRDYGRITINMAKSVATIFYTIAVCLTVYLTLSSGSINNDTAPYLYTAIFSVLAWFSLTVLAFYLSKFDTNFIPTTPIKPLNAKVITDSAPAILTVEEAEEPAEKESIYPDPVNPAPHHVDGESLHANPGEPLHDLSGNDDEEYPVIGKATTSTEHPDDFETFEKQSHEGEEN